MASAISGFTPTTPSAGSTSTAAKSLSGSDFLNLMIQQLSQQDPLNPTDSNQLLNQMSQISNLQANTDMQASLKGLTLQQSIGAGGNLIGKTVTGLDANGNALQGVVTSVKVADQKVSLELDSGHDLPLGNVTAIAQTSGSSLSSLSSSIPQLQQILGNNGTSSNASTLSGLANIMSLLGGSGANGTSGSATNVSNLANLLSMLGGQGG